MYFDAMATERDVKQKTNNFSTNHKDTEINNELTKEILNKYFFNSIFSLFSHSHAEFSTYFSVYFLWFCFVLVFHMYAFMHLKTQLKCIWLFCLFCIFCRFRFVRFVRFVCKLLFAVSFGFGFRFYSFYIFIWFFFSVLLCTFLMLKFFDIFFS